MEYLVIKCGGSIMDKVPPSFYLDLVKIKEQKGIQPVIVHGGGPSISSHLEAMKIQSQFINGIRITTEPVLQVVEMILSGSMNKEIVRNIIKAGGKAFGLSGVDGMLLEAKPLDDKGGLGLVGDIVSVKKEILEQLIASDLIPVVSPVSVDKLGQSYNINADTAAAAIAKALQASLCIVTDVDGVYVNGELIHTLSNLEADRLIENQIITGGMIPKVQAAFQTLTEGVKEVVMLNGANKHIFQDFVQGKGVGTTFYLKEAMINIG
ncbi:acetylglutamate kinase [Sutcliffiella sp. NPDC057660]|uniref:acetylglutamate kinase n=1 Tax=Sutcliffiella sp. NPDC057660 TaxID=3346199 RepID=UPI0036CCBF9F